MGRLRTLMATLAVAMLVGLAVACGGDDGGGGDSNKVSESQAKDAAEKFLLSVFGIFTGETKADQFLNQFAPECRENVDEDEVEQGRLNPSAAGHRWRDPREDANRLSKLIGR